MKLLKNEKGLKFLISKYIFAILILLLLIGCVEVETQTETTTEEVVVEQEEQAPPPPVTTDKEMSDELKALIAKTGKVKSLAYFYEDGTNAFQAYVKDNKMKIEFTDRKPVKNEKGETLYDTAYLDLNTKTVEVYCERYWSCRDIVEDEDEEVEGVATFNDFITQTPIDLIKSINYAEINPNGGQMMDDGKNAILVEYTDTDGNLVKIWLWEFRGIPLLYQKFKKTGDESEKIKEIEYHQVSIDTVLFKDVTKQKD